MGAVPPLLSSKVVLSLHLRSQLKCSLYDHLNIVVILVVRASQLLCRQQPSQPAWWISNSGKLQKSWLSDKAKHLRAVIQMSLCKCANQWRDSPCTLPRTSDLMALNSTSDVRLNSSLAFWSIWEKTHSGFVRRHCRGKHRLRTFNEAKITVVESGVFQCFNEGRSVKKLQQRAAEKRRVKYKELAGGLD